MRITASSVACLLVGGMLSISTPSVGQAQSAPTGKFSIAGEFGPRTYTSQLTAIEIGKFEEYRDLRAKDKTSILFEQLFLNYAPKDSFGFYNITARKLFDRDQTIGLLAKRPGLYDLQLRWDQIPHTYSTSARSPGDELGNPGFNTLPSVRPDSNAWRNGAYVGPIRNQVDPIKASLALTPNKNLDFKAEYTHIGKKGGIPRSVSFSGSSGPQREYVSPIDQTINDVRLSQGYASGERAPTDVLSFIKSYQANVSYGYSGFNNSIKSTMVDSPQLSVASFAGGTNVARVSLEPSNSAQTVGANGAVLLPMRTRFTGSVASIWARQNDLFLPQTSNDSLARDPNYGLVSSYTRPSLDALVRTTTYMVSASSHPVDKLTLTGRFKNFDQSNQTAAFGVKAMIVSDRTLTLSDSEKFDAHPFTKTNSNLSATYLLMPGLAVSAGYGWEDWKRDPAVRNIEKTSETTPRASIDYTALDWLSIRTSYTTGRRRGNTPYTEAATEILNFRRYDEADRDRSRIGVAASVTPVDQVTFGLTLETGKDKFPNSQYGIQEDRSLVRGVDVDWTPTAKYSVSAGWMLENVQDSANYRYRTGAAGSVTFDNPSYKWMNTNKDRNTTLYASGTANLIPDKLDLVGTWSLIDSHWQMFNVNPTTPAGGTAAQNLAATAQDWPEVSQRLEPMSLGLRYRYSSDWAVSFRYQMEKYAQTDFRTVAPVFTTTGLNGDPLLPVGFLPGDLPGTIGQVAGTNTGQYHFLGNNFHPYTANYLTLLISYHPALIPFARGRSTF